MSRIAELLAYAVDPKGALKRSAEYIKKCIKLGGEGTSMNHTTNEVKYFFLEREHSTSFETARALYQESS
eukprot:4849592-Lingulodinium_polyedra.AAC.1